MKDNFKQGQNVHRFSDLQKSDFIKALASPDIGIKSLQPDTVLYLLESDS